MVDSTPPSVTLVQGKLIETQLEQFSPRPVDAFLGVPNALPPTGERRFQPAAKVTASSDPIDASQFGPAAPGKAFISCGPQLEQSEDCLTANVFRPAGTTEAD